MEINLIAEAFKFMVLGMSTVFSFLILLVLILNIQAKVLTKFFPQKAAEPVNAGGNVTRAKSTDNLAVVAAIAATLKHKK